jgi:hypothetical protein
MGRQRQQWTPPLTVASGHVYMSRKHRDSCFAYGRQLRKQHAHSGSNRPKRGIGKERWKAACANLQQQDKEGRWQGESQSGMFKPSATERRGALARSSGKQHAQTCSNRTSRRVGKESLKAGCSSLRQQRKGGVESSMRKF